MDNNIDWCFQCANYNCKSSKQKMFAWIVLWILKNSSKDTWAFKDDIDYDTGYKYGIIFFLSLEKFFDNEAINKLIFKKRYWKKWFSEILFEHIVTNEPSMLYKLRRKPAISFDENMHLIVRFHYKEPTIIFVRKYV